MPSQKPCIHNLIWFKLALLKMRVHGSTDDVGEFSSRLVLEVEKNFLYLDSFPLLFYTILCADHHYLQIILVRKLPYFIINL